ncbi:thermostable hemolysin [Pseudomonadota bacterium]|nr:thermostable hemolysin [Pseudomonadota bacterium]
MEVQSIKRNPRKESNCSKVHSERVLLAHMPIQFDHANSEHKNDVEQFVANRFKQHYQAEITHFLPYLLSTKKDDSFTAAMGFQAAGSVNPLFLEQYLTSSIEDEIGRVTKQSVERSNIAEVGNLTSVHRGTSQLLFILSIAILHEAGFEWSVFTATKQVQQLLARLDLVTIKLCEADPIKLLDKQQAWGSYYQDKPNVMIGNLTDAIALLRQHKVIGFMLTNYQKTIADIASKIKL